MLTDSKSKRVGGASQVTQLTKNRVINTSVSTRKILKILFNGVVGWYSSKVITILKITNATIEKPDDHLNEIQTIHE